MQPLAEAVIQLPKRKINSILKDAAKCAEAVNLLYVTNLDPGITRIRKGKDFEYYFKDKKITDEEELLRIKRLVIPPAWEDVWICKLHNGHLQATGVDVKKRKQYRYHPSWNSLRNQTKFYRMLDRKSTRLNSSHLVISYAVFCLKKQRHA